MIKCKVNEVRRSVQIHLRWGWAQSSKLVNCNWKPHIASRHRQCTYYATTPPKKTNMASCAVRMENGQYNHCSLLASRAVHHSQLPISARTKPKRSRYGGWGVRKLAYWQDCCGLAWMHSCPKIKLRWGPRGEVTSERSIIGTTLLNWQHGVVAARVVSCHSFATGNHIMKAALCICKVRPPPLNQNIVISICETSGYYLCCNSLSYVDFDRKLLERFLVSTWELWKKILCIFP